jgi:beta-glucanase (GH16 family)
MISGICAVLISTLCILPTSLRGDTWIPVWSDEFDYTGLPDPEKWSFDVAGNAYGWGNNELQNYTDETYPSPNAWVEEGRLIIEARAEEYTHSGHTRDYTSARLRTMHSGDWLYGKIEVRAKLPGGRGTWPAIWMLPTDSEYGGWPASGEIDIMEYVGYEPELIHWTVHTESFNHSIGTQKGESAHFETPENRFYTYAVEWHKDRIDFLVDDQRYFTFENQEGYTFEEWPFDKRFHLLLNVAVGGDWGGVEGVDDAIFPVRMEVDYVRVYQNGDSDGPFSIETASTSGGEILLEPHRDEYEPGDDVRISAFPAQGYRFRGFTGSRNSQKSILDLSITGDLSFFAFFTQEAELLINGDFGYNLHYWTPLNTHNGARAHAFTENGKLIIDIDSAGENPWDVQINQEDIHLKTGETYSISFDGSHSEKGNITVGVARSVDPWTPYSAQTITLTKESQSYSFKFTMTEDTDENARFFFDAGGSAGRVTIDDASLTRHGETALKEDGFTPRQSRIYTTHPTSAVPSVNVSIAEPGKSRLEVFDTQGRIISSDVFYTPGTHRHSPPISSRGVYFLRLSTQSERIQNIAVLGQ